MPKTISDLFKNSCDTPPELYDEVLLSIDKARARSAKRRIYYISVAIGIVLLSLALTLFVI